MNTKESNTHRKIYESQYSEIDIPVKNKRKCYIILFVSLMLVLVAFGIVLGIIFSKKSNLKDKSKEEKQDNNEINKNFIITKEIAKKAFKSSFTINSKENSLTQLSLKSIQKYNTISNGDESSYSIFSKAKYDIFTISGISSEENNDLYSTKYSTVIALNSFCSKLSSDSLDNDCVYEEYLNLNFREENNLRRNEEDKDLEIFKQAILPICLIEHSNTNLIISVSCPETLAINMKNDIVLAFKSIKPESINGITNENTLSGTKIEKKNDKIYIESFSKNCLDYDGDPKKNMTCELIKSIITDKEGNLISSKKILTSETIFDQKNKFFNNITYLFEDITKQNRNDLNLKNFKLNLKKILNITKSFMKKENHFSYEEFNKIIEKLNNKNKNEEKSKNIKRNLQELIEKKHPGVQEENFFETTINDININLNIKNDIGFEESQSAKAISNYNIGNFTKGLSYKQMATNLNNTLSKFIILSKSSNKLAYDLFEKLNERILNLRDFINSNISDLNDFLVFKDLKSIFDSSIALDDIENLPYKFIAGANNLNIYLSNLYNDIPNKIYNMKQQFDKSISSFLLQSHNLLYQIFSNLTIVNDALSSKNSKNVEISTYYLNHTDTSYINIIQKAKEILNNYYIKEKELIVSKVNKIFIEYNTNSNDSLKEYKNKIDKIINRIESGKININLAKNEDYLNTINNLNNSNILVNKIVPKVEEKFKEALKIQSNGYFETQTEIDSNKKIYEQISEAAVNISYTLDKNELIDKTFDNLMINFRDKFIDILNYISQLQLERFPLEENVLSNSLFNNSFISEIDYYFNKEKNNIKNFIENEKNKNLNSLNEIFDFFKSKYNKDLEEIMDNLKEVLSNVNLLNLNNTFNEIISITKTSIDKLIDDHFEKATEYLQNVKNASSVHRTQALINKYNTFMNYLNQTRNFINENLKKNLANKYKNVIDQIKILLQSIKSNAILKIYNNKFPFSERHLNIIKDLFETFENYFSDKLFNTIYLPIISDYIKSTNNKLNQNEQSLINIYHNSFANLSYSSSTSYDYDYNNPKCHSECTLYYYLLCLADRRVCNDNYEGNTVVGTDSHNNLLPIDFTQYISKFEQKYNDIYQVLSRNINLYNNHSEELYNKINSKKTEILNKVNNNNNKNTYLDPLSEKIKFIINNELGENLLYTSYNYYKEKLNKELPNLLNKIIEKILIIYDEIYEDINSNKKKLQYSIYEFYYLSSSYNQMLIQNIIFDIKDSIVNKYKNEFNYTINYYYNLIQSKINKTYSSILINFPFMNNL